uniref:Non-structural maintenance of chromosomes element 4 n=1 Tax=Haemonchus contortus TaxID=6289 RepID=A0A7I5E5X4_HAECO
MPRPLRLSNRQDEDSNVVEMADDGLTSTQVQEANYLNSLATAADPSQLFAKRASLREAYHGICSQFTGDTEKKESKELIENLGKSLEDVDRSYQSVGAGGKELAADADSLLSMASVLLEQMKSFRRSNSERIVTAKSLADALILYVSSMSTDAGLCVGDDNPLLCEEEGHHLPSSPSSFNETQSSRNCHRVSSAPKISSDQWAWLGRQSLGTLSYDVSFKYQSLRSVVSFDVAPPASQVTKKERIKRAKDSQEAAVVLSSKSSISIDDEVSVAQELDKVRKALKRAWKEKPSVDFFSFVIDPNDFSKSVENMFHISFLVKDGRVRLSVAENGLPVLLHVTNEERQRLHVDDRSAAVTNQAIISFTYEMWEEMVEAMRLSNARE